MGQKRAAVAATVAAAIWTASALSAPAITVNGIEIAEPGSVVNGRSIGNLAANWWRFILETPIADNPVYGAPYVPGPLASEGISFLYGLPPDGPRVATRSATVSAGDALVMPLRNWVNMRTDPSETPEILFDQLEPLVASIRNLTVEIDGVDVARETGLDLIGSFREQFPSRPGDETFGVKMPDKDAFGGFDGFSTDLLVADGHWMVLNLPLGDHRIVVNWEAVDSAGNLIDSNSVTHEISAVPIPASLALILGALATLAGIGGLRSHASAAAAV